ncbi:MAG TPA: hypothetical protein VEV61_14045 [Streptosporangiaceae bacterium]|nr:hypothetical protein [Streptosporangiaceae bacterium]
MQPADSSQVSQRPRFPALDPEPPPRLWRGVVAALMVLLAGLASWLGYSVSRTAPHHSTAASAPPFHGLVGVVLAETPSSYLSETDLRTGQVVVVKSLGQFSSEPGPAVTPDDRYMFDAAVGRLVSLSSLAHLETVPNGLSFIPGSMPGFMADPWSDHDTGVVELSFPLGAGGIPSPIPVAIVETVRTGSAISLGPADSAGGDPQQEGAFIAVPGTGKPLSNGSQPDAEVVLADAGSRPVLLATTSQLERALGIEDGTAVSLVPIPNPQGSMVAVWISSIDGSSSGVVVLSRNGALLGSQPLGVGWAGWSHSGRTLAFVRYNTAGPELIEWTIGLRSVETALRGTSRRGPTTCTWSPDDTTVLCDGGPLGRWLVIRSGASSVMAGQGQPLVWTSGRLGR